MASEVAVITAKLNARKANVPRRETSDGIEDHLWAGRDGALVGMPWKQALVLEGRCYTVTVGTFSSPVTGGGAGTILDQDQPELIASIPSGYVMLPLRARVDCQVPLLAADSEESEILLAVDRTVAAVISATNGTVETPLNMRTDNTGGSGITVVSAVTVNITVEPALSFELAHPVKIGDVQTAVGTTLTDLFLDYQPVAAPFIFGPASLMVYWGGTVAVTGFASFDYAEWRVSELK